VKRYSAFSAVLLATTACLEGLAQSAGTCAAAPTMPLKPNRLKPLSAILAVMLATGFAPTAPAQVATATDRVAPATISDADRGRILTQIETAIRNDYVFPDRTAAIIARLEQARRQGRYDLTDAGLLADRLTEDLSAVSGDRHLYVRYDPARYAAATRPPEAAGAEDDAAYERRLALRENSGLVEMKILGGNLRYLKIALFGWAADETGAAYDDAMRFLRGGDALIIDLRGNPGGEAAAVQYLVSHFLDPDILEFSFLEGANPPKQSRTLSYLPGGRIKNKPLYVLIDGNVGSAAESFAYDVQQFKLGELVGSRTIGAANNNRFVPIAPGLMFSLSYGRPVHGVSGANWEGVGVQPSVPAQPAQALEIAERLALLRLKSSKSVAPDALADYDWALVDVEARLNPVALTPAKLESLAGRYGDITIAVEDGRLTMSRSSGPTRRLTPLTSDGLFEVDGFSSMLRVRFSTNALETLWKGDPQSRTYPRTPSA
jgi:hypothetical protein